MATAIAPTITDSILAGHADEIRRLGKRVITDVIEIGKLLSEAKRIAGRTDFLPWLKRQFGWSEDTAERFIQVATLSNQIPQVAEFNLPLSGLYMLAAPSTPAEAREEIIARAQAGEVLCVDEVKQTVEAAKGRKQRANAERYRKARERREAKAYEWADRSVAEAEAFAVDLIAANRALAQRLAAFLQENCWVHLRDALHDELESETAANDEHGNDVDPEASADRRREESAALDDGLDIA